MSKVTRGFALDVEVVLELEKRATGRSVSDVANEILRAALFRPITPSDAAKIQDLEGQRAKCIEEFRAAPKSEEKAEALMVAAIKAGLFATRRDFVEALKKANGVA